jgi:hypothetical protein
VALSVSPFPPIDPYEYHFKIEEEVIIVGVTWTGIYLPHSVGLEFVFTLFGCKVT